MSESEWATLLTLLTQAALFAGIFRKAGYSGWLGLLMFVPAINLITLFWFANADWPLEMGYVGQGDDPRVNAAWELKMHLRKALALQRRGDAAAAIQQFELVAKRAGDGHPSAAMARDRIRQLRAVTPE